MATLRVKEPFAVFSDQSRIYHAGALVDSADPVVKGRESAFEPVDAAATRRTTGASVETATAAPGEKRSVTPAVKKAAAKKAGDI